MLRRDPGDGGDLGRPDRHGIGPGGAGDRLHPAEHPAAHPGTPFGDLEPITNEEVLRAVAIFRYLNPTAWIRMAAGRGQFSGGGAELFRSGANAAITGDMLTTTGTSMAGTRPCSGPWAISCDKPERRRNYDAGSDDLRRGWTEEQDVCPGDDRPDGGGDLCAGPYGHPHRAGAHLP